MIVLLLRSDWVSVTKRCKLRHTSSSFVHRGNESLMYSSFDKRTSVERLLGVLT